MAPLEQEQDVEVLRAYAILATREVERLSKALSKSLKQEVAQDCLSDALRDQLTKLQEKFFGFGREKVNHRPPSHHRHQDLLSHSSRQGPELKKSDTAKPDDKSGNREPKASFYKMALEELKHEALDRGFDVSGAADWSEMRGFTQDSVEITVTERTYTKIVHKKQKYIFNPSKGTDKEIIVTAPGPVKVNPGCKYSLDFALAVVSDKYEYHCPLERQRRQMESKGLHVSVKTLYGLCSAISDHATSVMDQIKEDIFNDRKVAVHLDETPWLILGEESKGYMWVMSNRSATYFQFEPTRSGKIAEELLKNYQGAICSDGFSGYNRFKTQPGIVVGNCWAHVRREFYDIRENYPHEVKAFLDVIDEIFEIEYRAKKDWHELKRLRETQSAATLENFRTLLFEYRQKYLPGSGLVKAIDYSLGRWKEITAFVTTLALPLSNNDAERALRHVVMGRKNFVGSKTINGADVAATLYTVIESCKKAGMQPKPYLKYVATERWHKRQPLSPLRYAWHLHGKPAHAGQ